MIQLGENKGLPREAIRSFKEGKLNYSYDIKYYIISNNTNTHYREQSTSDEITTHVASMQHNTFI